MHSNIAFPRPHPPLLCSSDPQLLKWGKCEASLQLYDQLVAMDASVGVEGLHVTGRNNASIRWHGYSWMNWEGRGPVCNGNGAATGGGSLQCAAGTPNMASGSVCVGKEHE